jgi:hypothetical protein
MSAAAAVPTGCGLGIVPRAQRSVECVGICVVAHRAQLQQQA